MEPIAVVVANPEGKPVEFVSFDEDGFTVRTGCGIDHATLPTHNEPDEDSK